MQITELMPGDWVIIQRKIEKVTYLSAIDDCVDDSCWSVNGTHNLDLVKPIKLTDKILTASGFIELTNEEGIFVNGAIVITKEDEDWRVNWGARFELPIRYVHELQHIYSLLHLNLNITINGPK